MVKRQRQRGTGFTRTASTPWIQILALPLPGHVTLRKLSFSGFFLICLMWIIVISTLALPGTFSDFHIRYLDNLWHTVSFGMLALVYDCYLFSFFEKE